MYMVLFVLHDTQRLQEILTSWDEVGVSGITILPSTGLGRLRENFALRDDLPLIPRIENLLAHEEKLNRTIFTIVENDEMVNKIVETTEKIIGNLNKPNTGILAVLPVAKVFGLKRETD